MKNKSTKESVNERNSSINEMSAWLLYLRATLYFLYACGCIGMLGALPSMIEFFVKEDFYQWLESVEESRSLSAGFACALVIGVMLIIAMSLNVVSQLERVIKNALIRKRGVVK